MTASVTWETCPNCQRLATVAWRDGVPVEFDCPNGCRITRARIESTFRLPPDQGLPPRPERTAG